MGALTRGTTYSSGGTVNASNLEALVGSATLAGLTRNHINNPDHSVATRGTGAPAGPWAGEVWMDQGIDDHLKIYDGSSWVPAYSSIQACQLWGASNDVSQYDALRLISMTSDGVPVLAPTRSTEPTNFFGIALESASARDTLIVHIGGDIVSVNVAGAVSVGVGLGASATNGQLTSKGHRGGWDVFCIARTSSLAAGTVKAMIVR